MIISKNNTNANLSSNNEKQIIPVPEDSKPQLKVISIEDQILSIPRTKLTKRMRNNTFLQPIDFSKLPKHQTRINYAIARGSIEFELSTYHLGLYATILSYFPYDYLGKRSKMDINLSNIALDLGMSRTSLYRPFEYLLYGQFFVRNEMTNEIEPSFESTKFDIKFGNKYYFFVSKHVLQLPNNLLTLTEKGIYVILASFCNWKTKIAFIRQNVLAETWCKCSRDKINFTIRKLENLGAIEVIRQELKKSNQYKILGLHNAKND